KSSCPSGGTIDIFLEPMKTARKLLICGASPIAQAILTIAKSMDVHTIVAAQLTDHDRMVGADDYLTDFDISGIELSSNDAVIVATQGKRDIDALNTALKSSAGYKGMVCSRKKLARLKEDLTATDTGLLCAFEELHAPAGLNIGAIEPEEIGLAVVCEIIAKWRSDHTAAGGLADYSTELVL
ncbi:MAG: XdhC family protein, partial [Sneathiella sp.]